MLPTSYTGLKSWPPGRELFTLKAGSKHLLTRVSPGDLGEQMGIPHPLGITGRLLMRYSGCMPWACMAIPLPSSASTKLTDKPWE